MNGKGNGPRKGYNYQKYAENYDQIFRTMKPNQDETSMTTKQPAPVLAWHREAAEDMRNYFKKPMLFIDIPDPLHAMIAQRDPHAETVRLLEEVNNRLNYTINRKLHNEVRAHLAALKGTQ